MMNQQAGLADFNNDASNNASNFGPQSWNRGRGWLQSNNGGQGRGGFNNAGFNRDYVPVQLQHQQQMEEALLAKLHSESEYESSDLKMDKSLKTWKCEQCSLVNQLYYLKCLGCKSFLSTYIRVGLMVQLFKHYMPEYSNCNNNQFNINTLFASNINHLYLITVNKNGAFDNSNNVDRFVLRVFKPMPLSQRRKLDECYNLFNQINLGPKVFSRFEIGHIEEHINGKKIYHAKQQSDQVWKTIIDKIFEIQNIKPNDQVFSKKNDTFDNAVKYELDIMRKYINVDKDQLESKGFEFTGKDLKTIGEIITLFPNGVDSMWEEYNWLTNHINELLKQLPWENGKDPLVFSHNDIYQGNIMEVFNDETRRQMSQLRGQDLDQFINSNFSGNIKIIDYETCRWNNRYYDFANWLVELCIEYFRVPNYPYVTIDWNKYPNEQFRQQLGRYYLSKLKNENENKNENDNENKNENEEENLKMLFKILDLNSLLSDFYQGIKAFNYGIINEHEGNTVVRGAKRRYNEPEQIRMDYFEYSVQRLKNYWYSKEQIVNIEEEKKDAFSDLVLKAKEKLGFVGNFNNEMLKQGVENVKNTLGFYNENKEKEELRNYQNTLIDKYSNKDLSQQAKQSWTNVNNQIRSNNNLASSIKRYVSNVGEQVKNTLKLNENDQEKRKKVLVQDYNNTFLTKEAQQSWDNVNSQIRNNNNLLNRGVKLAKQVGLNVSGSVNQIKTNVNAESIQTSWKNTVDKVKSSLSFNNNNNETFSQAKEPLIKQPINDDLADNDKPKHVGHNNNNDQNWDNVNVEIVNNDNNTNKNEPGLFEQVVSNMSNSLNQFKNINTGNAQASFGNTVEKVKDSLGFNKNKQPDDETKKKWDNINNEIKQQSPEEQPQIVSKEVRETWDEVNSEIKSNNGLFNRGVKLAKKVASDVSNSLNPINNNNDNNNNVSNVNDKVDTLVDNDTKKTWTDVNDQIKNHEFDISYKTGMSEEAKKNWDKVSDEISHDNNEPLLSQGAKLVKNVASNLSSSFENTMDKVKDSLPSFGNNDNKEQEPLQVEARSDGAVLYLVPPSEKAQQLFNNAGDNDNAKPSFKESMANAFDKAKQSLGFAKDQHEAGVQQPIIPQPVERSDRPTSNQIIPSNDDNRNQGLFGDMTNKFTDSVNLAPKEKDINVDEPQDRTL